MFNWGRSNKRSAENNDKLKALRALVYAVAGSAWIEYARETVDLGYFQRKLINDAFISAWLSGGFEDIDQTTIADLYHELTGSNFEDFFDDKTRAIRAAIKEAGLAE